MLALAVHHVVRGTRDIEFLVDAYDADRLHGINLQLGYDCAYRSEDAANYLRGDEGLDPLYARRPESMQLLLDAPEHETGLGRLRVVEAEGQLCFQHHIASYYRLLSQLRNRSMTLSMHAASVPVFQQMLTALGGVLVKAESHAAERKIEPAALLQARLFPDMFPLARQVQIACDFASSVSARLAGVEVPAYQGGDQTFADLQQRIAATLAFIGGLDAAGFEGSEQREVLLRPGTPKERRIGGQAYLMAYGLPQFFFHVTTAYSLLRHNGVEIGKKDFMGAY